MPTYISLINYTDEGIKGLKDLSERLEAVRQNAKASGGEITAYYLTMGHYDAVVISEAPDDASITRNLIAAGAQGNVRTSTMRAFTESEAVDIVSGLP